MGAAVGAIAGGAAGLFGASESANATKAGAKKAAEAQVASTKMSTEAMLQMWQKAQTDWAPFLNTGYQGLSQLQNDMPQYMQQVVAPAYNNYAQALGVAQYDPRAFTVDPVTGQVGSGYQPQKSQPLYQTQQIQQNALKQAGPVQAASPANYTMPSVEWSKDDDSGGMFSMPNINDLSNVFDPGGFFKNKKSSGGDNALSSGGETVQAPQQSLNAPYQGGQTGSQVAMQGANLSRQPGNSGIAGGVNQSTARPGNYSLMQAGDRTAGPVNSGGQLTESGVFTPEPNKQYPASGQGSHGNYQTGVDNNATLNALTAFQKPGQANLTQISGANYQPTQSNLSQGGVLAPTVPQLRQNLDMRFSTNDPIYQYKLQQASEAANRSLAKQGLSASRHGVNVLSDTALGVAAEDVDKQYQRAINERDYGTQTTADQYRLEADRGNTLYGRTMDQQNQLYGRLTGMQQTGIDRLGQAYGAGASLYNTLYGQALDLSKIGQMSAGATGSGSLQTGQGIGQNALAAGNAMAQNYNTAGQANAALWAGAGNAIPNALSQYYSAKQIQGGGGGGYYSGGNTWQPQSTQYGGATGYSGGMY